MPTDREPKGQTVTEPLTNDQLRAIEGRKATAWRGPWTVQNVPAAAFVEIGTPDGPIAQVSVHLRADAEFIAHARQDVPALLGEVQRLTAENHKLQRDEDQLIGERDQAQEAADKLAYAIAPVEVIGEHSDMNNPWDNAHEELHQQRQELADTAMMRDFNQRSAEHIAAKRNLAEAAIAGWDRDEISGDAAVLMIRKALADGPASACACRAETVHQAGYEGGQ